MKFYWNLALIIIMTLLTTACGARGVAPIPTINTVDLQNTAAAVAFTMLAETQTALPTATLPPPTATFTETPAATTTVPALPSLEATLTPVPTLDAAGTEDPCVNQTLPSTLQGEAIKVRINNTTKATMRVSLYLNRNSPQGQCGYRAFNLEPGQFLVMNDLVEGCYTLFAWNVDPKNYFIVNNGASCLDNSADWVFDITTGSVELRT